MMSSILIKIFFIMTDNSKRATKMFRFQNFWLGYVENVISDSWEVGNSYEV